MRPLLHPALSRTWRDRTTLQFGLTDTAGVVLDGLGAVEAALLGEMTGRYDVRALRELAAELGAERAVADRLVDTVLSAGVAVDADTCPQPVTVARAQPELSSIALRGAEPDGGVAALDGRGRVRVDVHGAGRVGAQVARLLAASGVGDVVVHDTTAVRDDDVVPGGHRPGAVGRTRRAALEHAIRADRITSPPPSAAAGDTTAQPDAAILVDAPGAEQNEAADLIRHGVAHLRVLVVETTGVVGPLVLPGVSSCLRCHDLHRTDHDPHWPLALDSYTRRPPPAPACDAATAATVAGIATAQLLAHLDGHAAAAVDGTIEVTSPYGLPRRRSWSRHPACGCGWT
ncbi:hypothetical protein CLV30_1028 [Haloactinopolyspora alba]|uniref:Bacteriocin biosynthesis cyclodehydratase domain-containing protein n=1 Tax=Haloactinopolyspora alba TaxID=648780 RepID=A0A2P8EAY1_9ACTN|nr:thiamine biosynthesis protein ThiF [Haloactinopolyspora alba]PSL06624.1 hypothetical protein CLV30_1028 [Haloactinopolyspora alba]